MRGRGGLHRIVVFSWNLGPHTRQHSWAPGCFATLMVCSLVMCFFKHAKAPQVTKNIESKTN